MATLECTSGRRSHLKTMPLNPIAIHCWEMHIEGTSTLFYSYINQFIRFKDQE